MLRGSTVSIFLKFLPVAAFLLANFHFSFAQTSDIVATGTPPSNIAYQTFQENADITGAGNGLQVATFQIRDGGAAAPDAGGDPTRLTDITFSISNSAFIRRVALYDAAGTAELGTEVVGASSVSFSGLSIEAPDNGTMNFMIRVSFTTAVTDNAQFQFTITSATEQSGGGFSDFLAADAGGAQSGITGDQNKIEVTATKLLFVQQPTNTFVNSTMSPAVTVEAADANNIRDLDNTSTIEITSTGTLTGSPVSTAAVAGLATFSTLTHTATGNNLTLSAADNPVVLTGATSNTFNITAPSASSDIIANAGFTYPTNIAYSTIQENTDLTAGTSLEVAQFDIRDGAGAADADPLPTVLTNITFSITNSAFIRRAALYDGVTELAETTPSGGNISFSGLSLSAADGTSKTFSIRVSFTTAVTDNAQYSFTVTSATAQAGNSGFAAADAGGAVSSTAGNDNRIEVTATKLLFVQQPSNTFINTAMSPSVTVETVDANNVRDLDNTSTIEITSTGTLSGSPVSSSAVSGLATFATLTHTATASARTLSAADNPVVMTGATSSNFDITGPSTSSNIIANSGFTYPTNVAYATFQENSDIVVSGTSVEVAQFIIQDGGGSDPDPFSTVLTDITFSVANSGYIRRAALYDGVTELAETTPSGANIIFTGFAASAADNSTKTISLRVSFTTAVADNQQYSFTVTSATAQAGNSGFGSGNAGGAASSTSGNDNRIEVTATKLLFVQQPSTTVISTAMSPAVTVETVDANNLRDLDNTFSIRITSTGTLTGSPVSSTASAGLATFSSLTHTAAATGRTLSAADNPVTLTGTTSNTFTILSAQPSTQASNVALTLVTNNSMRIGFTGGNGTNALVVVKAGSAVDASPVDETSYTANLAFGSGSDLGGGNFVVYNGTGTSNIDITGLSGLTTYHVRVFEFNGSAGTENYNPNTASTNPNNTTTLCDPPLTQASAAPFGTINASTVVVNWTRGSGNNVIVLARDGTATAVTPSSGTTYTANPTFGSGDAIAVSGNDYFVVYNGSGTTVTVDGLSGSTAYNFKVFEYATTGVCYNTANTATNDATTSSASNNTTLTTGTGFATISSLANTSGAKVAVFQFTLTDLGDDGQHTDISQMIFRPAPGNDVADWTQAIEVAGAHLIDDVGTGQLGFTATIGTNTITISNIQRDDAGGSTNELGELFNGDTKVYTLSIWLKASMGGSLPTTIDGQQIALSLSSADITTDAGGSGISPGLTVTSHDNGATNGTVSVVATAININQQPSTSVNATVPLPQQPIFEAVDANNNRDLGFNFGLSVSTSNPDNIGPSSAPASFSNGLADFTASGFNFANVGTSTMSVTANSITSPNSSSITVSANTAVAQIGNSVTATNGIATSPLNSSATNNALLGFSLTTTGSVLNFTGLTLSTNSDPDGKIKNIELYHSTTNDFTTGTLTLLSTGTTPTAASINFTTFTQSISAVASYYFVVADVEDNVFVTTPQLELTLTPGTGVVVSTGSVSGGAFSGLNYSFIDTSPPTILSITNSFNPIYEGSLTQTVVVVFSEPMNPLNQPTITLSGTNWGAQNSLGWSTTTLVNDTYTATFTHNGTQQVIAAATSSITSPSGAQDVAGNGDVGGGTSASFVLDTQKPIATVTVDTNPIYTGDLVQVVTVQYTEAMNPATSPVITFGSTTHFTPAGPGVWSTTTFTNDTWTRTFNHDGTAETIPADYALTANTSGAQDVAGNNDVGDSSPTFLIDTKGPINVDISSPTANNTYTTGQGITIYVYYDETVIVTGTPTLTLSSGGTASYTSNVAPNVLSFSYTVGPGENATDLDVTAVNLSGGTIKDAVTNNASLALPAANRDLSFYTDIHIDTQAPSVVSVSSSTSDGYYNAGDIISIQVAFDELVNVGGTPQLALNSGGTANYSSGTGTATLTFQYTVVSGNNSADLDYVNTTSLTLPGGATITDVVSISAGLTLATPGNPNSISDDKAIVIDTILPTVSSIVVDGGLLNGIGSTNGTTATTVTYTVTFSEPVTSVDVSDFSLSSLGYAGFAAYPPVSGSVFSVAPAAGPATTYTVTCNNVNNTGRLRLNFLGSGTVLDLASNDNITTFLGQSYSIVLPEATNNTTGISAVPTVGTTGSITVNWTNASSGTIPTHLIITATGPDASEVTPAAFVPSDGTLPAAEEIFTDGNGLAVIDLVVSPTQTSYTFSNMRSGKPYNVVIYEATKSPNTTVDNINFKLTSNQTASATTLTASQGSLTAGTTSAPLTISSLSNAFGSVNFSFKIQDDGLNINADDAKQLFNQLIIRADVSNTVTNWSDVIEEAELRDITENNGSPITSTTIGTNSITFNLATSDNDPGELDDNEQKEYELRIRLKNPLTGTAPQTVDGQRFVFLVNSTSFVYDPNSSKIAATEFENSGANNEVSVIATELNFITQPPSTAFVLTNLTTTPVMHARDANGNTDRHYVTNLAITNSGTLPMSTSTLSVDAASPNGGVYTFPAAFQYTDDGTGPPNNGDLTVSAGGISSGTSTNVSVSYNNTTTITAGPLIETSISSLKNSFTSPDFDFNINEDNLAAGDGSPTRFTQIVITAGTGNDIVDWTQIIDQAVLYDGTYDFIYGTVNPTNITFSGLDTSAPDVSYPLGRLGFVSDNVSKNYQLWLTLKPALGGTLPATVDNLNLVFEVLDDNITLTTQSSLFTGSEDENSGSGNLAVDVDATQLMFTTNPASQLLVNKDISLQPPVPVVEALDINNNRDLDYNSATVTVTNAGSLPMSNAPGNASIVNGIVTFANNFQFNAIGNGTLTVASTGPSAVSNALSSAVLVRVGLSGTITVGGGAEPATISSLDDTDPEKVQVFDFTINDDPGGTPPTENDGNPILITEIKITQQAEPNNTITNWSDAIAVAELFDGTNTITGTVNSADITFSTIPITVGAAGYIADDASKTYELRIYLKSALGGSLPITIDGSKFGFEVLKSNIITDPNGTSILGGEGENSGVANEVTVVATQIDVTTPAGATSASLNSPFVVVIQARDANANRDLDFIGKITALTNATGSTMVDGPTLGTSAFTSGVYNFNGTFRFTTGSNGDDVTLTIKADNTGGTTGTTCGTNAICSGISPTITLLTSFESSIVLDPTFTIPSTIQYVTYQEAVNIQATATSYPLLTALLVDGSRGPAFIYSGAPLNTNTDSGDGIADADSDGANTDLNSITLRIYRPSNLRRIELYGNGTPISGTEIDVTAIGGITSSTAYYDFVWNGSPLLTAIDDSQSTLTVRVSFRDTAPEVTDHDDIQVQLLNAVVGVGSQFFVGAGYIAGRPAGTPGSFGQIDVIATSLDFTTAPSNYAGTNEPVGPTYSTSPLPSTSAAIVKARDKFALIDLDFDYPAASISVTGATTAVTATSPFVDGVVNLDGMQYTSAGNGTLTVQANGINSSIPGPSNIGNSIPGQLVDVINVTATLNSNGVLTTPNIKGGTPNAVLFGVTFTPDYATTTEPSLKKFVIRFDKPYKTSSYTTLENFRVTESSSGSYAGSTNVTLSGATVTQGQSPSAGGAEFDLVLVDWGANPPRDLFDPLNVSGGYKAPKTYYLVADVHISANISTPSLTPQLFDKGYGFPSNDNIVTTQGTAVADDGSVAGGISGVIRGTEFQFASTRPPVLLTSKNSLTSPYNGQLNVDPGLDTIKLEFDVQVWSLDGKAALYDRTSRTKVADLIAQNGQYVNTSTPTVNPLVFFVNLLPGKSLKADSVYYVTIAKGTFDNSSNSGEGISDNGFNFYGGISSNGTLYFKISSENPPALSAASPGYINKKTGTFSAKFDQGGTCYYMVIDRAQYLTFNGGNGNPPSATDVETPSSYIIANPSSVISTGSFTINQINSSQFVSFLPNVAPFTEFTVGKTYDIWIYGENDANPDPVKADFPYGDVASGYSHNTFVGKPTLQITVSSSTNVNQPSYLICPNSSVLLTEPIVITEPDANWGLFQSASAQDFYILLPSGFEFDGVTLPTVQLNGSDFDQTSLSVTFENNTLLRVSYSNTTSGSRDLIIISNLKISGASGSVPGIIKRFAGNASFGGLLGATNKLASISLNSESEQDFTNSFSTDNDFTPYFFFNSASTITAIPDNYVDKDATLLGQIRLIPQITPANDYGASFFSGAGVTNDILTLNAVALDAAFDITMTHTDMNGCVSETAVQYVVYDHESPISTLLGLGIDPQGTNQTLINDNFQQDETLPPGYAASSTASLNNPDPNLEEIQHDGLAGYELLELFAELPKNTDDQIMKRGSDWEVIVKKIPITTKHELDSKAPERIPADPTSRYYKNYQWDYTYILNAVQESQIIISGPAAKITKQPYNYFRFQTSSGKYYWKGGSLGKIEFTGVYQNQADLQVIVPFKQQVELFVPPIPLIEVSNESTFSGDTAIFCRDQIGNVIINGFPKADGSTSQGYFVLLDAATNVVLYNQKDTAYAIVANPNFTENITGSASFKASDITNNFKTMKVIYTYQDVGAPKSGSAEFYIRVTPNPVADFSTSTLCEDILVTFTDQSTVATASGVSINKWQWSFGDINSPVNSDTVQNPTHGYSDYGNYPNVRLSVATNFNCLNIQPEVRTLQIGGTPTVDFTFTGVSTADTIRFISNSQVYNDRFGRLDWDFGDGSTAFKTYTNQPGNPTDIFEHLYSVAGPDTVTLTVTSEIGCVASKEHEILILHDETASDSDPYFENFESNNGQWQTSPFELNKRSWEYGVVNKTVMKSDPQINGSDPPVVGQNGNVWATSLTGNYKPLERSYLYSPAFNIFDLSRPMISFNSFVQLPNRAAGVVVQYSTDNKNIADNTKTWTVLGTPLSGDKWYNGQNIVSKPGEQTNFDYGWDDSQVDTWIESKHNLQIVQGSPRIVFRFALATSETSVPAESEGFAIDNFRIGSRTRIVLVENFTNLGNEAKNANNEFIVDEESKFLRTFPDPNSQAVVKINYHVAFPKQDPLNLDNAQDPGARALYYNVALTPRVRMDGTQPDGATLFSSWGLNAYGIRSLKLADADIDAVVSTNSSGNLEIMVNVTALRPLGPNTIMHVALVEQTISKSFLVPEMQALAKGNESQFDYVLKKLLPSAAGTQFGTILPKQTSRSFGPFELQNDFKLYPLAPSPPDNNLVVVVFLQNEDTKEVYQTHFENLTNDPDITTGIENLNTSFNVYPIPADKAMLIELPEAAVERTGLQMYDQMGKVVEKAHFEKGDSQKTIDTSNFAAGVYLIQIESPKGILRRKVMVVHHN